MPDPTPEQIQQIRLKIDEPTSAFYDDDMIVDTWNQADGDMNITISEMWSFKAARYAGLVDTSESGSSRKMGDLYKNAKAMQEAYEKKAADNVTVEEEAVLRPRTRRAVRA